MRKVGFAALFVGLFFLAGCSEDDLGRYCVSGYDPMTAEPGQMAYNTEAPECVDRLCILQAPSEAALQQNQDLKPIQYCSHKCSSDSDCGGADDTCPDGYVCTAIKAGALGGSCACACKTYFGGEYSQCGQ